MDQNSATVHLLLDKAEDPRYYRKVIEFSENKYNIKSYKISDFDVCRLKHFLSSLNAKYKRKEVEEMPYNWHQNQKKAFIWLMVFYCYQFSAEPSDFVRMFQFKTSEDWEKFSTIFFNKNPMFLQFQAKNMEKSKERIPWNESQNFFLSTLVEYFLLLPRQYGVKKWNQISKQLFFRSERQYFKTPKQCRERWFNHLDVKVNKEKMSIIEDLAIISYVKENGKKWSQIALNLGKTRTQHQVKNRYYALINKVKRKEKLSEIELINILDEQLKILKEKKVEKYVLKKNQKFPAKNEELPIELKQFPPIITLSFETVLKESVEFQTQGAKSNEELSSFNEIQVSDKKREQSVIFLNSQLSSFRPYQN